MAIAVTRKKLAISWTLILELLHTSNVRDSSKSPVKANQTNASFYLYGLLVYLFSTSTVRTQCVPILVKLIYRHLIAFIINFTGK